MIQRVDLTGLILAGGMSRRFGADKARAPLNGQPLVAHVHAALAPLCCETLVSTGPTPRAYPVPGRVVCDSVPDGGPLAGLAAGLSAMRTPWLVVVAADLPFVTGDILVSLLAAAHGAEAAVAVGEGGRRQPLCAVYAGSVTPLVAEQLQGSDVSMRALLARLVVREVGVRVVPFAT